MAINQTLAEVNIHLRARSQDRDLIDQAAEISGTNRSSFMLGSALKEARKLLLDQNHIRVSASAFQKIMDMLDAEPSDDVKAGMKRLHARKPDWARD